MKQMIQLLIVFDGTLRRVRFNNASYVNNSRHHIGFCTRSRGWHDQGDGQLQCSGDIRRGKLLLDSGGWVWGWFQLVK